MILTKDNTDETIVEALLSFRHLRFYDPKTGNVFEASPCECCGTMAAHGGHLTIEEPSDRLSRTLQSYYSVLDFVETTGYNDDDELECEAC
jgi:hypothetical protein